jgi:molybdate transport system substrate-binding protein
LNLNILSAGAALGLVRRVEHAFLAETGCRVEGQFGAVGVMRAHLLAGAPCDLIILTEAMVRDLAAEGRVLPETCQGIGLVSTGVAVPVGAAHPDIGDAASLRSALLKASVVHIPDRQKSTGGIHIQKVLERLGIAAELESRIRNHPNGEAAMQAMAEAGDPRAIGCTQVTEIVFAEGVEQVGLLPGDLQLRTPYAAAVAAQAGSGAEARRLIELLTGPRNSGLRRRCGFE